VPYSQWHESVPRSVALWPPRSRVSLASRQSQVDASTYIHRLLGGIQQVASLLRHLGQRFGNVGLGALGTRSEVLSQGRSGREIVAALRSVGGNKDRRREEGRIVVGSRRRRRSALRRRRQLGREGVVGGRRSSDERAIELEATRERRRHRGRCRRASDGGSEPGGHGRGARCGRLLVVGGGAQEIEAVADGGRRVVASVARRLGRGGHGTETAGSSEARARRGIGDAPGTGGRLLLLRLERLESALGFALLLRAQNARRRGCGWGLVDHGTGGHDEQVSTSQQDNGDGDSDGDSDSDVHALLRDGVGLARTAVLGLQELTQLFLSRRHTRVTRKIVHFDDTNKEKEEEKGVGGWVAD